MSTNDVPGARAANRDVLAMGCWAEHKDGSLIFVESTEGGRVVYSIFDPNKQPPLEYRDTMPEDGFKDHFSWKAGKRDKWTWHDKTAFPWDKVIGAGFRDGLRETCAEHVLSAAERVAQHRGVKGRAVDPEKYTHLTEKLTAAGQAIVSGIQKAITKLNK